MMPGRWMSTVECAWKKWWTETDEKTAGGFSIIGAEE
jgi:hypothetical protein